MPIPLIVGAAIGAATAIKVLAGTMVVGMAGGAVAYHKAKNWWGAHRTQAADPDVVAYTDVTHDGRQYVIEFGLYNQRTQSVVTQQILRANELDGDLQRQHAGGRRRVYHYETQHCTGSGA